MAASAPPIANGYTYASYPADYSYPLPHHAPAPIHPIPPSHLGHPPHVQNYAVVPPHHHVPPMEVPIATQSPPPYPPHMAHMIQPASPISPVSPNPVVQHTPSPCSAGAHNDKSMRHLLSKLQSVMSQIAERQGEILDRLSILEQKVGRMDECIAKVDEKLARLDESADRIEDQLNGLDSQLVNVDDNVGRVDDQVARVNEQLLKTEGIIGKVLGQVEMTAEDSRSIRARVDDDESRDAFEKRLTMLMDGVVEKLINGLGTEVKDIKKMIKDTEKHMKVDIAAWNGKSQYMGQRFRDAAVLGEEEQQAIHV
ncbi:hypothetical protein BDZ91DRAFT_720625 [Kalaharituber pfeilii]|nr:hypothetical protein BDZ91DRAFT_720625 [Kalaharituber pfeilii]